MTVIAALQLEVANLMEEMEDVVVTPLQGAGIARETARLAGLGKDIATLSAACEVLVRRSAKAAEPTGLRLPPKR
ncbi:hypothetical protein [Brevundimonas sp. Leaf363]|uniref:hypothetical protein n=1 Tax=Brevundimonas sp. Leaf363 TaxID=1736353 RepID=UPI0006F575E6|nr:hypothetical protein [Brevundimonas sp. Leaf363]